MLPCHIGSYVKWWKESYALNLMEDWQAQSPDLIHIEYVLSEFARKLYCQRHVINNIENLQWEFFSAWESHEIKFTGNLLESMHKRCQSVIDNKRDSTTKINDAKLQLQLL
ncbi:MAG: hypothetical protein EXX96DRAFT_587025 [Benjaminiella poitrasii]|nr:MAG: hypothetical protein EXX96DRAFT_587025 [Benjaminiella poitrasii]